MCFIGFLPNINQDIILGRYKQMINNKHLLRKDFMEKQQHGFSDSTPRAGSDRLQKSAKSLLSK